MSKEAAMDKWRKPLRAVIADLKESTPSSDSLFVDCGVLPNVEVPVLTYALGDEIIAGSPGDKPHEKIMSPSRTPLKTPAWKSLGLKTNPLFLVLKGYVEIHRASAFDTDQTVPALIAGPGDTFGELEMPDIEDTSPTPPWTNYLSQATAGFRTVFLGTGVADSVMNHLKEEVPAGFSTHPDRPCEIAQMLYHSFYKCQHTFDIEVAVIPFDVVSEIAGTGASFKARFYRTFAAHARTFILLHPAPYGKPRAGDELAEHFVTRIAPAMEDGRLPVLVSCEEYCALAPWWKKFHDILKDGHDNDKFRLRDLNLPYNVLVPAGGQMAADVFKRAKCDGALPPFLSGVMIASLTAGRSNSGERLKPTFLKDVQKAAQDGQLCLYKPRDAPAVDEYRKVQVKHLFPDLSSLGCRQMNPPKGRLYCLVPKPRQSRTKKGDKSGSDNDSAERT